MNPYNKRFVLFNSYDVVTARQYARQLAREMGFDLTDQTRIATAVSEVSRRALNRQGVISFAVVSDLQRRGMECTCVGCTWLEAASGIPTGEITTGVRGVEKLMDDFELQSGEEDDIIVMRKWLRSH